MNEYKEFLKHLGIKPSLMLADMISRLPDSKKPVFISRCKEKENTELKKQIEKMECCGNCKHNEIINGEDFCYSSKEWE